MTLLQNHYIDVHYKLGIPKWQYKCLKCPKFQRDCVKFVRQHMEKCPLSKDDKEYHPFPCDKCTEKFDIHEELLYHQIGMNWLYVIK